VCIRCVLLLPGRAHICSIWIHIWIFWFTTYKCQGLCTSRPCTCGLLVASSPHLKTYICELQKDPWPWQHSPRDREIWFSSWHWRNPTRHEEEGESSCCIVFVPFSIWAIFKSYYPSATGYSSPSPALLLGCNNLTLCYLLSCHYKLQTI